MSQGGPSWDEPTRELPSQNRASSDQPTQQLPSSFREDPQTRRRFLKAAIASGAAVAAVGVAGAAAASASPQLLRQLRGAPEIVSGQDPTTMCIENSNFVPIHTFTVNSNGKTQPGTFFIWFTAHHLPAGTYTFTLTPTSADATKPFKLNDNGNNVFTYEVPDGKAPDCPSCDPTTVTRDCPTCGPSTLTKSGHNISNDFPYKLTSLRDFQVRVHLKYNNGPITSPVTYTFVGTLTNTGTLATYTHSISVTAKKA